LTLILFIKNRQQLISSWGFSALEKNVLVGCDSPLQIVMVVWGALNLKMCIKWPLLSTEGSHALPDHSAKLFAEGRRALKSVKAL
jgi:hypothetical protein